MKLEYNISEIAQKLGILGYAPQLAGLVNAELNRDAIQLAHNYENIRIIDLEERDYIHGGQYGLPIWQPIQIFHPDADEIMFNEAVIELNRTKNIIQTNLQGYDGTVKEYISNGDYVINIKGMLTSKDKSYPREELKTLLKILEFNQPLRVLNTFLNDNGIFEIVVTSYAFPVSNFINALFFEIQAISDKPIELKQNID